MFRGISLIKKLFRFKKHNVLPTIDLVEKELWHKNIANKVILKVIKLENSKFNVLLYTRSKDIIQQIYNKSITLKDNEILNINNDKVELLPINSADISLPFIPFEIAPAELASSDNESDIKAYSFQNYLIRFIIENKKLLKDNYFSDSDFFKLNKAFLFLNLTEEEKTCCYICKASVDAVYEAYVNKITAFIDRTLGEFNNTLPMLDQLKKSYLKIIKEKIDEKTKELKNEKENTVKMAETNNLNLFLPDVENHFDELNKRLINFNYQNVLDCFNSVEELLSFWPSWLSKPEFLINKDTLPLNRLKVLLCLKKLNFTRYFYNSSDELKEELKNYFVAKAKIKKNNLLKEIKEYLKGEDNLNELKELYASLSNLDVDKEFSNKESVYSILLHWPELLFPEPLEIKTCKDLLFDNLEIPYNVE